MQHSTTSARALTQDELRHSRYLDAVIAFRPETCLRMDGDGSGADGGGAGGSDKGNQGGTNSGSGGQGGSGDTGGAGDSGKGFPENTPVAEMTQVQQTAYWKFQSQKHEGRNRDLLAITGGKFGDDLKNIITEHSQLKQATLTDGEKAVETAKQQTRAELAAENVRAAFDLVLPDDMSDEKKQEAIEVLNLAAFLTPDGKVDTAKVKTHAASLAPAKDTGSGGQRDYGQGNRGNGQSGKTGVSAGADLFAASRRKSSTSS